LGSAPSAATLVCPLPIKTAEYMPAQHESQSDTDFFAKSLMLMARTNEETAQSLF
jgi:hypothetical protein